MTSNSIAYANLVETQRHNAEQEKAKVAEIAEARRHNLQYELEQNRHNLALESETNRSNMESESINRKKNAITDTYNQQQVLLQGYNAETQRVHFTNLDNQAAINQSFNEWSTQKNLYLQALRQEADQAHYERQDTIGFGQLSVSREMAANDALKAKAAMRSASAAQTNASASMINAFTQQEYSAGRLANETLLAGAQAENLRVTGEAATLNAETQRTNVEYQHEDRATENEIYDAKTVLEYRSRQREADQRQTQMYMNALNPFITMGLSGK